MYNTHTICRACGFGPPVVAEGIKRENNDERLVSVLNLGVQPLANDFVKTHEKHAGYAPLEVLYCPRCTLAQLSVVVDPERLYRHYAYVTSPSATMASHFATIRADIEQEIIDHSVFEIGCNDGRLLKFFGGCGYQVAGIDPADNLTQQARADGLLVQTGFWGTKTVIPAFIPGVILARHVFCHVHDWVRFMKAIDDIASIDTLVCIEVPWAHDLLKTGAFDTIYHEHLSYFTLRSMEKLLEGTQWHMHRVFHYPIHGGAIMVMLRNNNHEVWGKQRHASVESYMAQEQANESAWRDLDQKRRGLISMLKDLIQDIRWQGKRVVAYGASAKCTVLLNECGFTKREIAYVTDTTPTKLYRNVPGTDIPVLDEGALTRDLPHYALMTAWNYAPEIIAKEELFKKHGGKWIVPVPELRIV